MNASVISGSGLWTPRESISNEELVASQLAAARRFNREHAAAIEAGEIEERALSSVPFIVKASGVQSRYVIEKSGGLDPDRMQPRLPLRGDDEPSIQCEISLLAIHEALERAGREPAEVDAVLVACSNLQRAYPAVAVEVQDALHAGRALGGAGVDGANARMVMRAAHDLEVQQALEGVVIEERRAAGDMTRHVLALNALADDVEIVVALVGNTVFPEFEHRVLLQACRWPRLPAAARMAVMIGS